MNFLKKLFKKKTNSRILNVRNVQEYEENDSLIFHAAFTILCDFVEKEMGGIDGLVDHMNRLNEVAENSSHVAAFEALGGLYTWYTSVRWDDPSMFTSEEYDNLLESGRVKYKVDRFHDGSGRYSLDLEGSPEDIEFYETEREKIIMSEEQFDLLCTENLVKLMRLRPYLWT